MQVVNAIKCKRNWANLNSKWPKHCPTWAHPKWKKIVNTKGNMLGNLDFTLQLKSKVLVYSQVAIFLCYE
jgi:hypothetical protein